jgi:hypothetical protein
MEKGSTFVSPTGYVDLDNDCGYSIDLKSTRSREYINPKDDLAFYFNNYLAPKYGLDNINVSNVASFMKELEMNWSKLTPDLKDKVLDIMVDGIFNNNYDFKSAIINKLGIVEQPQKSSGTKSSFGTNNFDFSNFGFSNFDFSNFSFSNFGFSRNTLLVVIIVIIVLVILFC